MGGELIGAWVAVLAQSAGVAAASSAPVPIQGFDERIAEEVQTSGVFVVAAMAANEKRPSKPNTVYVSLPETDHPRLCVQVKAIDALYEADGEFDISNTSPGVWDLTFQPKLKEFAAYADNEIAIDARVAEDCANTDDALQIVSAWTEPSVTANALRLFLNTDGNDGFILAPTIADNKIQSFECNTVESERSVRVFGAVCEIASVNNFDLLNGWVELRRFGREVDWEELNIRRHADQQ